MYHNLPTHSTGEYLIYFLLFFLLLKCYNNEAFIFIAYRAGTAPSFFFLFSFLYLLSHFSSLKTPRGR